ncbi:pectinesterase [Pedobacter sp. HMWF019]|uniref:pectinesterase family protein n=1 Tax=Pedobacter sp. HMWF019 TaxID=2056856 RepID=UPI000D3A63CA|nr:pectinesterase family protein [Pedobacter sp. HMWF019]PTT01708.1 pectinesterase [Pedobacter sp. HMWF019]
MKKSISYAILMLLCAVQLSAQTYKYSFTVAKDGTGDYTTIQEAINAMRAFPLKPITLYIKNGVYNEKIDLPAFNTTVRFIGESVDKTIITFNDYSGRGKTHTFNSYTARISGNDFQAENITFINSAGPVGQAVALHLESDRAVFKNCRFLGCQDTLYLAGENSRQYFKDCYIEGTTDFIFGPATAFFEDCTIHSKANSYITAANTPEGIAYGFVFYHCKLTADSSVHQVYLGRPWRAYAKTVFRQCELGAHIRPQGWHNWSNPEAEKNSFYAEYKNTGAGSSTTERVAWSKQLSAKQAAAYTLEKVFTKSINSSAAEGSWYTFR